MDVASAARSIENELRAEALPGRAEGSKSYLKSDLDFIGASVPAIRKAIGRRLRARTDVTRRDVLALAKELWASSIFERKLAAVVLLERSTNLLTARDLPYLRRLIEDSETWALVDGLAVNVVGALVADHPGAAPALDRWARSPNHWVRRSALLGLMQTMKRGAEHPRFFGYANAMLDEKEFFIRKAIGWVLREVSKTYPDAVFEWLEPRANRASGVTVREAVKHLSREQQARIAAARSKEG